jgi:hypothetical protein
MFLCNCQIELGGEQRGVGDKMVKNYGFIYFFLELPKAKEFLKVFPEFLRAICSGQGKVLPPDSAFPNPGYV